MPQLWYLFISLPLLLLLIRGFVAVRYGKISVAWNKTGQRLGLLAAVSLFSLLVSSNKVEAILSPFGQGTFLALFLLSITTPAILNEKMRIILRWIIMTIVSLVGLLVIYQFAGLSKFIEIDAGLMTMFIVTLPLFIGQIRHPAAIVMGLASLGGLLLTTYQTLPQWQTTTLPYWANWQILLESYKDWRHLLIGVGAENFLAAFSAGRPVALNMGPLWNTRFTLGSSLAFHIASVYGLLGAAAFGWFLTIVHPVAILAFLFLPPSLSALVVVAALLIISDHSSSVSLKGSHPSRLIAVVALLIVTAAGYGLVRSYGAELAFAKSLSALEARDGTGAYNAQIQAITRNPHITRFHTAYSQTNLALANAIASNTATASADRQTATQLIQQAIREAKIGVNLAPTNILAWENIASVYQTLTGVAQGADQWTVAAYSQAMQLDPTNPTIRLRLGGAYVGQQKLDQAAESYAAAITLKPDYANAYYNLAFVYRQQKKYLPAAQAIKEATKYVTPGSDDGNRAQKELDELRELLTEKEKQALDTKTQATPNVVSPLP